ncbi:thioredoxin family protein [Alienimonas chondri]|uniref:thioredoxin family protein n=1 Tax=Alienimonas chondri TaxID=2681879 RepID=UPI00148869D5|nr:thioredoxin family protein [Alienimonas chondri]
MSKFTAILLLLALSGCDAAAPDGDPVSDRVRAAFALAAAERDAPPRPDDGAPDERTPDPNCPRCHGAGTVPSGDGLARVPCDCLGRRSEVRKTKDQTGAASADRTEAAPALRVLVFSASWCPSCVAMKPALAAAGAGFEVIDVDAEPEVTRAYGVTTLPTLIRLENDRETARSSGTRDVSGLRRFRDGGH